VPASAKRVRPALCRGLIAAGFTLLALTSARPAAAQDFERLRIEVGPLTFDARAAGPQDGPLVLLLHGFPETSWAFRHQLTALGEAGFRAVAPDQRGYSPDARPDSADAYRTGALSQDVVDIADALGARSFHLVGHDWGGAVAWHVASVYRARIARLAVLNCPHPAVLVRHLRRNPRQMLRSWYFLYFQLPWLPEAGMRLGKWAPLRRAMRSMSTAGAFKDEDFEQYQRAWSQPGAMRAMVNWYRAMMRTWRTPEPGRIEVPTLLIWGEQDTALGKELAGDSIARCDDGQLELLPQAGHFVQHDAAEEVNRLLVDFLKT